MKNKNFLPIVVFCLMAVGVGYYMYKDFSSQKEEVIVEDITKEGENNQENKDEIGNGNGSVEIVEVNSDSVATLKYSIPVPNLDKEVLFPASTPPAVKERMLKEITYTISLLKQDSNLFNQWSDLGLLLKSINDYVWARDVWEYAAALRPKDSLVFTNLGNLYGYYLKELEKAEKNYLQSIENDQKLPYLYVRAALFYLEVSNDKEKAKNVIEEGFKNIPGDDELEEALTEIDRF